MYIGCTLSSFTVSKDEMDSVPIIIGVVVPVVIILLIAIIVVAFVIYRNRQTYKVACSLSQPSCAVWYMYIYIWYMYSKPVHQVYYEM